MVTRLVVVVECDFCGATEGAEEHVHSLDGRAASSVDACVTCWTPYAEMFEKLSEAGRSKKVADRQRSKVIGGRTRGD